VDCADEIIVFPCGAQDLGCGADVTDTDLSLLKASIDQVVVLEMKDGGRDLAQIMVVFDEGETPDVFYVKVERGPDGSFVLQGRAGQSVLLSEIAAVRSLSS
jgi:hypothetical protein